MSVCHLCAGAHGIFWSYSYLGAGNWTWVFSTLEHSSRGQPPKPVHPSYHVGTKPSLSSCRCIELFQYCETGNLTWFWWRYFIFHKNIIVQCSSEEKKSFICPQIPCGLIISHLLKNKICILIFVTTCSWFLWNIVFIFVDFTCL